jgi:hypothetical protein
MYFFSTERDCRGRDRMVVGFTTTYVISVLSPLTLWVLIPCRRGVLDTFNDETIKIIDTVREHKYWNDNLASVLLCKITMMNFRILYIIFPNDFIIKILEWRHYFSISVFLQEVIWTEN